MDVYTYLIYKFFSKQWSPCFFEFLKYLISATLGRKVSFFLFDKPLNGLSKFTPSLYPGVFLIFSPLYRCSGHLSESIIDSGKGFDSANHRLLLLKLLVLATNQ